MSGSLGPNLATTAHCLAKSGAGAALLKDLCQAEAVVKAVVDAVPEVPVTVKVRSGWDSRDVTAIRFARAAVRGDGIQ